MKKIILLLTCGLAFCTGTAQTLPKWANQAKKAVFSVITYNKDNKICIRLFPVQGSRPCGDRNG